MISKLELSLYDVAVVISAIEFKIFKMKNGSQNRADTSYLEELLDKFKNTNVGIGEENE